jgi:hypothetical protein
MSTPVKNKKSINPNINANNATETNITLVEEPTSALLGQLTFRISA